MSASKDLDVSVASRRALARLIPSSGGMSCFLTYSVTLMMVTSPQRLVSGMAVDAQWWQSLKSPKLDALIETALQRLEAGQLGTCSDCRCRISDARLRALPFAALCLACQERHDLAVGWKGRVASARTGSIGQ